MLIGHPIPRIQLIQNLTKIQGQGHGWSPTIQSTHIRFIPCQSGIPFLSYDFFKISPWKSIVKVMGEVTVQSHNVGLTSYRLTSLWFHVNRPSHSRDTAFSKFWHWKSRVKVKWPWCYTTTGQFHKTSNGINPSSGFRDMGSAMSGPSAACFDKFLDHGQAHMEQLGKWPWQCTTTGLDNSTELRREKIRQAVTEIWIPQVWLPPARLPGRKPSTHPPARIMMAIPLQPEGLRGKNDLCIYLGGCVFTLVDKPDRTFSKIGPWRSKSITADSWR